MKPHFLEHLSLENSQVTVSVSKLQRVMWSVIGQQMVKVVFYLLFI